MLFAKMAYVKWGKLLLCRELLQAKNRYQGLVHPVHSIVHTP